MPQRGLSPNEFTFSDIFAACSALREIEMGKKMHSAAMKSGVDLIPLVSISIFNLYAEIGSLIDARTMFDCFLIKTIGLWNKMMCLFVGDEDIDSARKLFDEMPERDKVSWNTMLSGYVRKKEIEKARFLFNEMPERNVFSCTVMIRGLSYAGDLNGARKLFDEMPERNIVSWNCMLSSYTQSGRFKQAMDLFFYMQSLSISPDSFTLVSALSACSHLCDLKTGKWIHIYLIGNWPHYGPIVGTALMEMYAKCGDIDSAFRIFIKTAKKDLFCWNVMIKALATHGRANDALQLFASLTKRELQPNEFTFMSVLFACSHGGMVEDGRRIFEAMETEFKVRPRIEHYGCLIDSLCRAGLLDEAYLVVKGMPCKPDISVWGALLGGCRAANDTALAKRMMEGIVEDENKGSGVYSIMLNMYAGSSQWSEAQKVGEKIKDRRIWKTAGFSSVW